MVAFALSQTWGALYVSPAPSVGAGIQVMSESLQRILIEVARDREDRNPLPRGDAHKHLACGELCTFEYFHPSAIGQCERRVILSHAGVEGKPYDDQTVMFFWLGDIIHDAVQRGIAKKLPGQVWNEVSMRDNIYRVSGRLDTLRLVAEDGVFGVYEYKTVRSEAFQYRLPKPDAILQVLLCQIFPVDCPICLGYESMVPQCVMCQNAGVVGPAEWGKIAYIDRQEGRMEVYDVTKTPELEAALKQKLMRLQVLAEEYATSGTLPDRLPKIQLTDKDGKPEFYVTTSKKFGYVKGQPKLKDDWRVRNCPYLASGKCCGDRETTQG